MHLMDRIKNMVGYALMFPSYAADLAFLSMYVVYPGQKELHRASTDSFLCSLLLCQRRNSIMVVSSICCGAISRSCFCLFLGKWDTGWCGVACQGRRGL